MNRRLMIFAALGAVGLVSLAPGYTWTRYHSLFAFRYELKLATGPIGSHGQKLLAAFMREVAAERPLVRLVPVPTESLAASAKALMDGKVDLAVVRSDDEAAAQGRTLFLLRRMGIAVLLAPESKIESVSELVGKKLGVTKAVHIDPAILKAFTDFYGVRENDLVELSPAQLGPALKAKRVAAVIASDRSAQVPSPTPSPRFARASRRSRAFWISRKPRRSPRGGPPTTRLRSSRAPSAARLRSRQRRSTPLR